MGSRAYRRVFASGLVGYPGRFADITVVAWLVVERTDAPLAVALIVVFRFLPFLVVGPFVGVALDRLSRLHIIRAGQTGAVAAAAAMAALTFTAGLEVWHIYIYALVVGMSWMLEMSARRAYIRQVVERGSVTSAYALEMLAFSAGAMVGSNLAGGILDFVHPGFIFAGSA